MVKFLHTADLHLDTPFTGLQKIDGQRAQILKDANHKVFSNIVSLAIREEVDFVVIAGDIFDGRIRSLNARLTFSRGLTQLHQHGIWVYAACGNHDPMSVWDHSLKKQENLVLFSAEEPESLIHHNTSGEAIAEITGMSHKTEEVSENLAALFPRGNSGLPSIAVLHGNLTGESGHDPYAPFSMEDLKKAGQDYWALGHVHKSKILREARPAAVYSGNPQGRDFGEAGEKGCYLVTLDNQTAPEITFRPTMEVLFEKKTVDISGTEDWESFYDVMLKELEAFNPSVTTYLRLILKGRTELHTHLINGPLLEEVSQELEQQMPYEGLFLDKLEVNTATAIDPETIEHQNDFTGALFQRLRQLETNEDPWAEMEKQLRADMKVEVRENGFPSKFGEDEKHEIIEKARWLLYEKLQESAGK